MTTVRLYPRPYGTGHRWRLEAGDLSVESGSRSDLAFIGQALAKRRSTTLVVEDGPEQLTLTQDEGMTAALLSTDAEWAADCDRAIRTLAATGQPFTAYDLHAMVREPSNPNHWGPRLPVAAKRGLIRKVGYRKSDRPGTRGSAVAVWQGIE